MAQRYFQGVDITVGAGASVDTIVRAPQDYKKLIKIEYDNDAVGRLTVKSQTLNQELLTNVSFQRGQDNTWFLPEFEFPANDIFIVTIKNTSAGSITYNFINVYEQ